MSSPLDEERLYIIMKARESTAKVRESIEQDKIAKETRHKKIIYTIKSLKYDISNVKDEQYKYIFDKMLQLIGEVQLL